MLVVQWPGKVRDCTIRVVLVVRSGLLDAGVKPAARLQPKHTCELILIVFVRRFDLARVRGCSGTTRHAREQFLAALPVLRNICVKSLTPPRSASMASSETVVRVAENIKIGDPVRPPFKPVERMRADLLGQTLDQPPGTALATAAAGMRELVSEAHEIEPGTNEKKNPVVAVAAHQPVPAEHPWGDAPQRLPGDAAHC